MLSTHGIQIQSEELLQPAGYGAYRRVQTETSSPGQLVVMLYSALSNDLQRAEQGLRDGDRERVHDSLLRAQDIVMELLASLDPDSGELARRLAGLYQYLYGRLVDANVRNDGDAIREVVPLVASIRDAWIRVVEGAQSDAAAPGAGRGRE